MAEIKKETVLRLRCTQEFKEAIDLIASDFGLTTSEYVRIILRREVKKHFAADKDIIVQLEE